MTRKPQRLKAILLATAMLLTVPSLPAQAETPSAAGSPQAGIGARLVWGGFGLDGYWAQGLLDERLLLGVKGGGGLIGGGPAFQAGLLGGWRLPLSEETAFQAELSAGALYANSAIGGGGPFLRDWSVLVEPALRYMWQVAPEAWMGLVASCGITLPFGGAPVMPLPAIGVSITTMRPR